MQGPQATESAKLTFKTNGFNLMGATVVLLVRPTGTTNWTSLPCVVNTDNTTVYRITQPTDFPVGGEYDIQLKSSDGVNNYSPILQIVIGSVID